MSLETPTFDVGTKKDTEPDEVEINKYYAYKLSAADDETALNMLKEAYRNAIVEADDEIKKKKREAVREVNKDSFKFICIMSNGINRFISVCFHLSKDHEGLLKLVYNIVYALLFSLSLIFIAPIIIVYDLIKMHDILDDNENVTQGYLICFLILITVAIFIIYYAYIYTIALYVIDNWYQIDAILREKPWIDLVGICYGIPLFFYCLGLLMVITVSDLKAQNDTQLSIAFLSLLIAFASMILGIITLKR